MRSQWHPQLFGGIHKRSTSLGIVVALELVDRAKRIKNNIFMYNSDGTMAYDLIIRNKVCTAVHKTVRDSDVANRRVDRHAKTCNVTIVEGKKLCVRNHGGVVQGDANGPIYFNIGYQEFGADIDRQRDPEVVERMTATTSCATIQGEGGVWQNGCMYFLESHRFC